MELFAQLGDAHTAVIDDRIQGYYPPYRVELEKNQIVLREVPAFSTAARAGIEPGWIIECSDPEFWLKTTADHPGVRSQLAARRALSFSGEDRQFTAKSPQTQAEISWVEESKPWPQEHILQVRKKDDGWVILELAAFQTEYGIEEKFQELCLQSNPQRQMVLDLRGCLGSNIMLATSLRSFFLREETLVAYSSFTDGHGRLSQPHERWVSPSSESLWKGKLYILVDELTYSAAEDFVLGLKGLDHVQVLGK